MLQVKGKTEVNVQHEGKFHKLELVVLNTRDFTPLLGRNWMDVIFKNWRCLFSDGYESVNKVSTQESDKYVKEFKIQFPNVFSDRNGAINGKHRLY